MVGCWSTVRNNKILADFIRFIYIYIYIYIGCKEGAVGIRIKMGWEALRAVNARGQVIRMPVTCVLRQQESDITQRAYFHD